MKTAFAILAFALVLHQGLASPGLSRRLRSEKPATCPGAVDTSCSAFASLEILVTSGKCSGTASADCTAVSKSTDQFVEAFDEWWGEEGVCDSGKAETAATAIATAVAKVWSNAAVKVTCKGQGFACGWSIANGNTFAIAHAEAIAQAAAEAGAATNAESFCFADIRAVSSVFAEAAAKAQADACTTGGTVEDFEKSYVVAVQKGIATAFAQATASACEVDGEVEAASKCSGEATSTTDGDVVKGGDACGGIRQLNACTGKMKDKCCAPDFTRSLCTCRGCGGAWFRKTKRGDLKKSYANRSGELCFCVDTADDGVEEQTAEPEPVEPEVEEATPTPAPEVEEPTPTPAKEEPEVEEPTPTPAPEVEEPAPTPAKEEPEVEEPTPTPAPEVEEPTPTPAKEEPEVEEPAPTPAKEEPTPAKEEPEVEEPTPTPAPTEEAVVPAPEEGALKEGQVAGEGATTECPGAADTTCSAFATLEILVTAGKCSGTASADCTAVTESKSEFKDAFDEWWSDDGECDSGKAEAAATAVAKSIAKVWANASVKVSCDGHGFACGWSISGGKAWAIAFAEALAQASAEAASSNADAFCFADIRSISVVIAEAAAAAQADACTTGGTVEDFERSYAASIQIGIAEAFAHATAQSCSKDGDEALAASKCSGEASSTTEGDNFASGNACAGIAQIKACEGAGKDMCCASDFKRKFCSCNRAGCKHGPWIRKSNYNIEKNTKRSFEDRKGNVCFCLEN